MKPKQSPHELLKGDGLLTAADVSNLLQVSRSLIYKLRDRGILTPVYITGHVVRYRAADIRAYMKELDEQRAVLDQPFE